MYYIGQTMSRAWHYPTLTAGNANILVQSIDICADILAEKWNKD